MLDMSSRPSKRLGGTIRNIANQLAQIAVGWEAAFDGPVLLEEPATGGYAMDLIRKLSTLNERQADLGMMSILDNWLQGELARLNRDSDWIGEATVEVRYELVPSGAFMDTNPGYWTSQAYVARLSATVHVATSDGAAAASFKNAQAVTGLATDVARPMPVHPGLPAALRGRWRPVEIKGKRPAKHQRDA